MPRIIFVLLLMPLGVLAQKKVNIGVIGGFANYSGDLQSRRFTLNQAGGTVGGFLTYQLAPKWQVRGTLEYGKIGADDKLGPQKLKARNLNFHTRIYEASLVADYSLNDLTFQYFTPYVFGGLGIFRFNPYTFDSVGRMVALRPLGTEGQGLKEYPNKKIYSMYQFSVPFGGGIRLKLSENVILGYEIGLRKTFTDYLDDVSTTYADEATLASQRGRKAVEMAYRGGELKNGSKQYPPANTIRGSAKYKDWYYFSGITLSIGITNENGKLFGRKIGRGSVDCPPGVL